jgi:hypothetical protein
MADPIPSEPVAESAGEDVSAGALDVVPIMSNRRATYDR